VAITDTLRKKVRCHYLSSRFSMRPSADYFCRNQNSLTARQQHLLEKKRVAVIGCGGLGGYVIEELVRIGVGRLHIFDPDVFSPSNCNRQLNALETTLGCNKAEVAARRSASIHPFSTICTYAADFRAIGGEGEGALQVDVVADCLDNIQARRDLAALCNRQGIPLVHGAVNGWHGQVGVQLPGDDLINRLYPERLADRQQPFSVLSFTVAVVASFQAAETVKLLLGLPSSLSDSWLHIDLKDTEFLINKF
jgi:molybdopterin-synthase adenylyltransferase